MQETLVTVLSAINSFLWGPPTLILFVGTGILLTVRLGAVQFRLLGHAFHLAFIVRHEEGGEGDISHFQALMTALSATVGTGNIVGVATAISLGGPGALFWMWVTGFVGMATKYAESVLAVRHRVREGDGTMSGGPMYYLENGLSDRPWARPLAIAFAASASIAAFGIGNLVQANSVAGAMDRSFDLPPMVTGGVLAAMAGAVLLGGIRWIGRVTSLLVPLMILLYVGSALFVLAAYAEQIPHALGLVFEGAFGGTAAMGGFTGAALSQAIRFGVARGVFSNESGLGSSAMAAAAAVTRDPVRQGLVSMTQTFLDTIVVCTLTGLVLLTTGAWASGAQGVDMAAEAFEAGIGPAGGPIVAVSLALFAFSTILGWGYYGEKTAGYLLGKASAIPYRIAFAAAVLPGALFQLSLVWALADAFNALMAIPNLIALIALSGAVTAETERYASERRASAKGGP